MKLEISSEALKWFKEEFVFTSGTGIRFYGKVYGSTNIHEGFSVGISIDAPDKPLYKIEIDGILFFIERDDDWFFQNLNLNIDFDENQQVPIYTFFEIK